MATKARIGIISPNKVATTIEVAYEGYPEYTGALLKKNFNSSKKLKALMAKGDIIQLEEKLDEIEHDELLGEAKKHRFVGNLVDLANESLADYTYFFIEETKEWMAFEGVETITL